MVKLSASRLNGYKQNLSFDLAKISILNRFVILHVGSIEKWLGCKFSPPIYFVKAAKNNDFLFFTGVSVVRCVRNLWRG